MGRRAVVREAGRSYGAFNELSLVQAGLAAEGSNIDDQHEPSEHDGDPTTSARVLALTQKVEGHSSNHDV
jgi:hypothetical protein